MARPRLAENDTETGERILAAAEEAFARHGYAETRLEDVAAAAGVRRPSLLYHFGSKDALYANTVRRVFEGLRSALVKAMSSEGTFEERVDATVGDYVAFLVAHPNLARIFLREVLDTAGPGRALLESEVAPLLEVVELFVRDGGRGKLAKNADVRGAVLNVVGGAVLYAVAGDLRPLLWREGSPASFAAGMQQLFRTMILEKRSRR